MTQHPTASEITDDQLDALRADLEQARRTAAALENDLAEARDDLDQLRRDLADPDDDPGVQCWHTEPGTPCDWNRCRQPERLAAGDPGTDPAAR